MKIAKVQLEQLMIAYSGIRGSESSCILIHGDVEGRSNYKAYKRLSPFIQLLFNKPLLYTRHGARPCLGNRARLSLQCLKSLPVRTLESSLTKT